VVTTRLERETRKVERYRGLIEEGRSAIARVSREKWVTRLLTHF